MVVAAGAAKRQPQKGGPRRVDRIFQRQVPEFEGSGGVAPAESQKPGGDDALRVFVLRPLPGQDVSRQLFPHQLVVGLVCVERIDEVIAISVDFRYGIIRIVAGRVGVADHIHPVPSPALAIARRG
jgi:hypothetical protein